VGVFILNREKRSQHISYALDVLPPPHPPRKCFTCGEVFHLSPEYLECTKCWERTIAKRHTYAKRKRVYDGIFGVVMALVVTIWILGIVTYLIWGW